MKWAIGIKLAILTLQTITANAFSKQDNTSNFMYNTNKSKDTFLSDVYIGSDIPKMAFNNEEFAADNYGQRLFEEPVIERNSLVTIARNDGADDNEEVLVIRNLTYSDVVLTEYGPVMGTVENNHRRFFDIPYGKVEGIFQAPLKPDIREELHDKLFHDVICPQLSLDDDETLIGTPDCLTLSIFTPIEAYNASVLFHLNDGNFRVGSGNPTHYGPENILSKDIIVVLPNYRLGPLGYLCLGRDLAPGNAALKDLALALEWTFNNIENFGGNPNNIVVSGEGPSGALSGFLALSEKSRHFVSKVITESGSFLSHLAIDRSPYLSATKFAENLNKGNGSTNIEVIFNTTLTELLIESRNITFKSCIENGTDGFITESPWKTLSGNFFDKTFMMGSANLAGYYDALKTLEHFESNVDWTELIPEDLYFSDSDNVSKYEIASQIKNLYIINNITGSDEKDIEILTLYHTDAAYLGPDIRAARALTSAGSTVYFYEFSYNGATDSEADPREVLGGALKGDMMEYIFMNSGELENTNDEEITATLTQLWASFINTGIPASEDIVWSQLAATTEADETWLSIGAVVVPETGLHINRLALWTQIYDQYYIDRSGVATKQFDLIFVCFIMLFRGFCI